METQQLKDLANKFGQRAIEAENLLQEFQELVKVGAISLKDERVAELWLKYHNFLASPERINKAL